MSYEPRITLQKTPIPLSNTIFFWKAFCTQQMVWLAHITSWFIGLFKRGIIVEWLLQGRDWHQKHNSSPTSFAISVGKVWKRSCIQNEWNGTARWSTFRYIAHISSEKYLWVVDRAPHVGRRELVIECSNECFKWQSHILSRTAAGKQPVECWNIRWRGTFSTIVVVMKQDGIMSDEKMGARYLWSHPGWLVWAAAWRLPDVRWLLCTSPDTSVALSSSSSSSSYCV